MKKFTKSVFAVTMVVALATSMSPNAFAVSADTRIQEIAPMYVGTQTTHSWSYKIGNPIEKTSGNWKHLYTGSPAKRDGEYDTVSHSVSYGHTYSGSFGMSIKDKVQAELGISFSKTEEFSISKNSAPLKKDEYIKAYWIKNYDVYDIKQTDSQHTYGFKQAYPGGPYQPVNQYKDVNSTVKVSKAIQPKIKIEYWKNEKKVRGINSEDMIEKEEYYQFLNGEYQLIYTKIS